MLTISLLYGFIGALIVLALLALGLFLGWKAHEKFQTHTQHLGALAAAPVQPALTEQELEEVRKQRHQLQEEQAAFRALYNYNLDMAYGVDLDTREKGE